MRPRFVGRLGLADAVSAANAALGFLAVATAAGNPQLAARFVLLAAVGDGLDGVLARRYGGTPAGEYLDGLADVASFGVAPAALVAAIALERWPLSSGRPLAYVALLIPAAFVAMAVVRLALYTAYDTRADHTEGVPSTLAATLLASAVLAGVGERVAAAGLAWPAVLLAATAGFCYLMVSTVEYPDLLHRDAFIMGVVHSLAVLRPDFLGGAFPYALFFLALSYLLFAPWFYWRETAADAPREGHATAVEDPPE